MSHRLNRRTVIKSMAASSAVLMGARGYATHGALADDPTPVPTSAPISLGEGDISITIWAQDFGPAISRYQNAAETYLKDHPNISVTVQPIAFADLLAKMLPSIAAGTEADIMQGYTNWYVGTDITRLFLPLDEYMGGVEELEKAVFPATMEMIDVPEGKVYYMPYAAGIRGAATTVNVGHFDEAGIDYLGFKTWEDVVAAGQELTVKKDNKIVRAGLSPVTAVLIMVKTMIWQLGGEFYDRESGVWSLSGPEGEEALQRLYDLYWGDSPTSSYDLVSFDDELTIFNQDLISMHLNGAWAVQNSESTVPDLDADAIPTPPLDGAVQDVVYPDHGSVTTLSRRLADDEEKRTHCVGILKNIFEPDLLIAVADTYSGAFCYKSVYEDPRIDEAKYGPVSKRIAEGVWPRSQFPRDHVANQDPAQTELDRALRKEISIKEALANADDYLNDQEKQARERISSD